MWPETVHQHFITKSGAKSSKFIHDSFWMPNNHSSASQLSTTGTISTASNARVLALANIILGTYVATNCLHHLTNSFSSSGHPFLCSQNLKATLSAAAGSVCIKTKCVEIQPSSIPWKPLDEIYQFHSLRCSLLPCRDLHFQNLNSSISQIFDTALLLFPRIRRLARNRSSTFHHEIGRQVK